MISQAGISAGHDYGEGVNLLGFDPDTGTRSVTTFPQSIKKGDLSFRPTRTDVDGAVLLGTRLASRLTVYPGDVVTLVPVTQAKVNPALGVAVPKFWKFEVTGLFDTGMFQYDNQFVVVSREMAQKFTGLGDAVSGIAVRVTNPDLAPEVGRRIEDRLGYPFRTLDWQTQNASLFSALELEKLAMGLIIFFIMVVAAFNIVGTLTMVVTDKTREIGILQAMGLTAPVGRADLPRAGRDHRSGRHGARPARRPRGVVHRGSLRPDPDQPGRLLHRSPPGARGGARRALGRPREPRDRRARDAVPVARGRPAHAGRSDPARMRNGARRADT